MSERAFSDLLRLPLRTRVATSSCRVGSEVKSLDCTWENGTPYQSPSSDEHCELIDVGIRDSPCVQGIGDAITKPHRCVLCRASSVQEYINQILPSVSCVFV